jgi:hypothetical protein
MQIPEEIHKEIINSHLIKFYRTEKPESTFWHEGLGNLESFKIVFELDNGIKYKLEEDELLKWNEIETLTELKTEHTADFKNQKIAEIIVEKEFGGIFMRLNNEMVIHHRTFFGSELAVENYDEVFNEKGELL